MPRCMHYAIDGCGGVRVECREPTARAAIRCCTLPPAARCLGSFCHAEQDIQSAPDPERATLHEAVLECAAQGGRLCSADELLGGECCGTGCGYDGEHVWR